jgi:hypothetical protein
MAGPSVLGLLAAGAVDADFLQTLLRIHARVAVTAEHHAGPRDAAASSLALDDSLLLEVAVITGTGRRPTGPTVALLARPAPAVVAGVALARQ